MPLMAEAAEAAESATFVVVDLGIGRSWYPTRLFALAAAAEELQGARAVVILAQHGGVPGRFVGWILPKDDLLDLYVVISDDGKVITVCKRLKHLKK